LQGKAHRAIILKESIIFRAAKKEQLIQKINCSECDSFQLYQVADDSPEYMGIESFSLSLAIVFPCTKRNSKHTFLRQMLKKGMANKPFGERL